MSEINLNYPLACDIEQSKETVQQLLDALHEKYAIEHEFINEHECLLSGTGVSGKLLIKDDGIDIFAKLGFFMSPFKSVIETEIVNKLNQCFAP